MKENDTTPPPLSAFNYVNVKVLDDLKKFEDSYTNYEVLSPNTTYEDITYEYTDREIKEIIKGKAYLSIHKFPVTIGYKFPYIKKAYEARMQIFKSFDEMKNFIDENKGIVIYKMLKRRDETRYSIRFFDGLKFCCKFEYYYNNLLLKLSPLIWKTEKFICKIKTIMNILKS